MDWIFKMGLIPPLIRILMSRDLLPIILEKLQEIHVENYLKHPVDTYFSPSLEKEVKRKIIIILI